MNNHEFTELTDKLESLTFVQLKKLRQHVEEKISANHVSKAIAVHEE